jgi:triosephosphate isomerase
MRRPVIAGNWKMFKTLAETSEFFDALLPVIANADHCDVVIAPTFTALHTAVEKTAGSRVMISAQNVHGEEQGAFTGEISAGMLRDAGCGAVIIGHSERRQFFGETDLSVSRKVPAVIGQGMNAIVCVGETLDEREAGSAEAIVKRQLSDGLAQLTGDHLSHIIIAYEPVWAIGTGRTATPEGAAEMHALIRGVISDLYGGSIADALRILYGGSVKPGNISDLMVQPDIDGALVGGASLEVTSFASIIHYGRS